MRPRTAGRLLIAGLMGLAAFSTTHSLQARPLTFAATWKRVLEGQPQLEAAQAELRALASEKYQAGRRPNPELGLEVDDVLGSGALAGTDGAETTALLSQRIERGGKREARETLAEQHLDLSALELQQQLADLYREARQRFVSLLLAQQHAALTEQQLSVARENLAAVRRLHKAAGAAVDEVSRAEMELRLAELRQEEVQRRLEAAQLSLAALWGGNGFVSSAEGKLLFFDPPAKLQAALADLPEGIDMAVWRAREERQQAAFDLERARGVPDVTVSAGVKRLNGVDEYAMTFGASVPLQFFNDNRGNIRAARERISAVANQGQSQLRVLQNAIIQAYQRWLQARTSIERLENRIVPEAETLVRETRQAYQQGRYTYLRVLDAQSALIDAQERLLEAKGTAADALTTLARYLGPPPVGTEQLSPDANEVE